MRMWLGNVCNNELHCCCWLLRGHAGADEHQGERTSSTLSLGIPKHDGSAYHARRRQELEHPLLLAVVCPPRGLPPPRFSACKILFFMRAFAFAFAAAFAVGVIIDVNAFAARSPTAPARTPQSTSAQRDDDPGSVRMVRNESGAFMGYSKGRGMMRGSLWYLRIDGFERCASTTESKVEHGMTRRTLRYANCALPIPRLRLCCLFLLNVCAF